MVFLSDSDYNFIYNQTPRLCVDLVVRVEGGIVLSLRDIEPYKGLWHMPGGKVGFKETLLEAAKRIAKKELGVEVEVVRTLGACEILNDDLSESQPRHSVSIVLEVSVVAGTPHPATEAKEVATFSALPEKVHPYHGPFLAEHVFKA